MRRVLIVVLVFVATPIWAGDPACEEQCNLDYWACSDACGPFGGALCEQQCVDTQNSCLHRCSQCPSVRDYSTITLLSITPTGGRACLEQFFGAGRGFRFREQFVRFRVTNYRETTHCDGTKTTIVLSSNEASDFCWDESPFPNDFCSPFLSQNGFVICGF